MAQSLRKVLLALVATLVAAGFASDAQAGQRRGPAHTDLYAKKATWAETLLAARAAYVEWEAEKSQEAGHPNFQPFDSGIVSGTGPAHHVSVNVADLDTMRLTATIDGGGGNCHIWGDAKLIAKDGTETPLSTLRPLSVRVGWGQLLVNKNWQDHPLQIADKRFKHGIWVHADSDVAYALGRKYERFDAWVGMDADRATGAARFKVLSGLPDLLPAIWQNIAHDFPVQSKWLTTDAGRGQELRWFTEGKSVRFEQGIIGRALGEAGAAAEPLRRELNDLAKAKTPPTDPAWLNVYARACRAREAFASIREVPLAELRAPLEQQLAELAKAKTPPEDPKWGEVQARADHFRSVLGPIQAVSLEALKPSIEELAAAFPTRFTGKAELLNRLATQEQAWKQILTAAVQGDKAAIEKIPEVRKQVTDLQRSVRLGLQGVKEFIAASPDLEKEWESQFESLQHDVANRGHFARLADETHRPEAMIQDSDRDPADIVLRRTAALIADLKRTSAAAAVAPLEQQVISIQAANGKISLKSLDARYALFADACRVRRQAAFANPLLAFNQILFIKRHRSSYDHMCDQFYGITQRPGGGLYVLSDPFGPKPQVRDVLATSKVENGRLKGQKIWGGPSASVPVSYDGGGNVNMPAHDGGSFLSPDLSCDAKTILFAYVECQGDPRHRFHTDPTKGHWAEGRCYHVFKVGVDGSNLEMLTDGTWNDFDPCWLPNGRIAMISERRGGYLRCGRVCPTYTLYDMAADGSDIRALSYHETNEWQPSVTHDGRIIYTRWDYIDRHGCTAHLPWITTLDGCDSRAVHGNFAPRSARPDMELGVRAIPGSHKFIATAAPHHGQAFGSLVLVDPWIGDDDKMMPVKRITPEVGFPESQGGAQVYGTPWPLSEDYYLAVYDATMQPGVGMQGGRYFRGNYGIYLVDAFGNKELLYRDSEIGCQDPIPLRPTPPPPLMPVLTAEPKGEGQRGPGDAFIRHDHPAEGTLVCINVYDALFPWPEGTKIKALRVYQVLPMTVPSGGPPHETGFREPTAGDSVNPCRMVLGTVPVEADGSANFTVPATKELFFQALDEHGLAIQSMRSATYLQEGERLVCQGCHEPHYRSPQMPKSTPLALLRPPSRLTPDVDGSNPFSYPRLVQPVLDRNCVACHAKKENTAKAPNLGREPITRNWYASFNNLAQRYGFTSYGGPLRTIPGKFGARASKLYEILEKGHYDVKLSPEDMHRITLWLDSCSLFYGVFEKEGGQAQLRGEIARPTLE